MPKIANLDKLDLNTYQKYSNVASQALKDLYVDNVKHVYGGFEDYHLNTYERKLVENKILLFNADFDTFLNTFFIGRRGKKYKHLFLTHASKDLNFNGVGPLIVKKDQLEQLMSKYRLHNPIYEHIATDVEGAGRKSVGAHDEKLRMDQATITQDTVNKHFIKDLPKGAYIYVDKDINIEKVRPMTEADSKWANRAMAYFLALRTSLTYKLLWLARMDQHASLMNPRTKIYLWNPKFIDKRNYIRKHHYTIKSLNCLTIKEVQDLLKTYYNELSEVCTDFELTY